MALPKFLSELKAEITQVVGGFRDPQKKVLMRFVGSMVGVSVLAVGGAGTQVFLEFKRLHPNTHAAPVVHHESEDGEGSDVADAEESEQGEHEEAGREPAAIFSNPLPASILERQDGVAEKKDLEEVELQDGQSLKNRITEEHVTAPYNPFVEIEDILASTDDPEANIGHVATTLVFEVDSMEALNELRGKKNEIRYAIAAIISERKKKDLLSQKGKEHLKEEIFREINNQVQKGRVKDVLFSNFVMR